MEEKSQNPQIEYVLIVGQGRSGTNWLLDLLDLSPWSYCRNEADKLANSPFHQLPSPVVGYPSDEAMTKHWDEVLQESRLRMGVRDRIGINSKVYLSEPMRLIGGRLILQKQRVRGLLAGLSPGLEQPEWNIPQWFINASKFSQALPVFKLNQIPGWAQWVLNNRPNVLVVHITRHPGGFLNSWQKRYLNTQNSENVKQENRERLEKIAQTDQEWAERLGDIEGMTVEASELWYWCYTNEKVYLAGQDRPNYLRIIYEDLVKDPLTVTKTLYERCGLPWTETLEQKVQKNSSNSQEIATAWSKNLSSEQITLVEYFLSNSFMGQWWIS